MRTVVLSVLMAVSMVGFAQSKIGYVNIDEVITSMPETKAAEAEMKTLAESLQSDLRFLEEEYQNQVAELENGMNTGWSELMIKTKQEALYATQQKIMEFQQSAQKEITDKEVELMEPIIEKLQNAVNDVAREEKYDYVLDSSLSKGVVIFKEGGTDIGPLVKAKLGM